MLSPFSLSMAFLIIVRHGESTANLANVFTGWLDVAPPHGESLQQTQARAVKYYDQEIVPVLRQGKNVLVVAHGNTLRGLRMHLEDLTPTQVVGLEIVTGGIRLYHFDSQLAIVEMSSL